MLCVPVAMAGLYETYCVQGWGVKSFAELPIGVDVWSVDEIFVLVGTKRRDTPGESRSSGPRDYL